MAIGQEDSPKGNYHYYVARGLDLCINLYLKCEEIRSESTDSMRDNISIIWSGTSLNISFSQNIILLRKHILKES